VQRSTSAGRIEPSAPRGASPPAPPFVAPKPPAAPAKPKTRKRATEAVTVRKRREKAAFLAAASNPVQYQTGTGASTLGSIRFFHLTPQQQQQLIDYAKREFKARPC
jgi:hypothetical protein